MSIVDDKQGFFERLPFKGGSALLIVPSIQDKDAQEWLGVLRDNSRRVNVVSLGEFPGHHDKYDLLFFAPEVELQVSDLGEKIYAALNPGGFTYFLIDLLGLGDPTQEKGVLSLESSQGRIARYILRAVVENRNFFGFGEIARIGAEMLYGDNKVNHAYNQWRLWLVQSRLLEIGYSRPGTLLASTTRDAVDMCMEPHYLRNEVILWKPESRAYLRSTYATDLIRSAKLAIRVFFINCRYPLSASTSLDRIRALASVYSKQDKSDRYVSNVQNDLSYCRIVKKVITKAAVKKGNSFYDRIAKLCRVDEGPREEIFERLYIWLQNSFFHHPYIQMMGEGGDIERNPLVLCYSGIGRCGHVAIVAKDVFEYFDFEARITQLAFHLCAEVKVNDKWRLVDCDAFKGGIYPRNSEGVWASVDEMRDMPQLLDSCPAIGLQLSKQGIWARNGFGELVEGYVDTGLSWDRPHLSALYFGNEKRHPPRPPQIEVAEQGTQLRIEFLDVDAETKELRLCIGSVSRGWKYADFPTEEYLRPPSTDVLDRIVNEHEICEGITVNVEKQVNESRTLYLSVFARGKYMIENKDVYTWPSDECKISLSA